MSDDARSWIGVVAGVAAVGALIPYILSIVAGRTKPSCVSWAIWTLAGVMMLATYRASGATTTIWVAVAYVINPLAVAILALRYGTNETSRLDWYCLAGALASLVPWLAFRSALAALYLNILVDALGAIPILRKAYADPASEDLKAWLVAFAAAALNVLALASWAPQISVYPLYGFLCMGSVVCTLIVRRSVGIAAHLREPLP